MNLRRIFALPVLALLVLPAAGQITAFEYWIDDGYDKRVTTAGNNGRLETEVDMSGLSEGLHYFMFRAKDARGQWSTVFCKRVVYLGRSYGDKGTAAYEYWIDGDENSRVSGTMTGGTLEFELDTDGLTDGPHTVYLRVRDDAGRWSSPMVRFFAKTDPMLADNKITAYQYWFNNGGVTTVGVDPANPFTADGLLIDIKDVVANDVGDDYTVDWETMTAYIPDDVVFAIRYGDATGQWTEARTATFAYNVPQVLAPVSLESGDTAVVNSPDKGLIYAYETEAQAGDSLVWTTGGPCRMDVYDAFGNLLERVSSSYGPLEYKMRTEANGKTYALVYGAETDTLAVSCSRTLSSGIAVVESGVGISCADGRVTVSGAVGWQCVIYSPQGYEVCHSDSMGDVETFAVSRGVYVISLTDRAGKTCRRTVIVK